jgi:hypothetical protein
MRQCAAGLILYDSESWQVEVEYRCEKDAGHAGQHVDGRTGWGGHE